MATSAVDELLQLNQLLLESIASGDWSTYQELCNEDISCFEPEARGHLVEGLRFHKFYFDLGAGQGPRTTTMASPRVKMLGDDVALVAYVRLVQRLGPDGTPQTTSFEETRLWRREAGRWRHVHFHRSAPGE